MPQKIELFTDNNKKQLYASTSSFIERGSILDRRKTKKDRRISQDRRASNSSSQHNIDSEINKKRKHEISLNLVRVLEEEYRKILSLMNQLILTIELKSYSTLPNHLHRFDKKIKSNLNMEEDMLYLFVDSLSHKSFKEKNEIHALLDNFIYSASQKIIELVKPYLNREVSETNAKSFLADIDKIDKILARNHKQKEDYLYKIYVKCYV